MARLAHSQNYLLPSPSKEQARCPAPHCDLCGMSCACVHTCVHVRVLLGRPQMNELRIYNAHTCTHGFAACVVVGVLLRHRDDEGMNSVCSCACVPWQQVLWRLAANYCRDSMCLVGGVLTSTELFWTLVDVNRVREPGGAILRGLTGAHPYWQQAAASLNVTFSRNFLCWNEHHVRAIETGPLQRSPSDGELLDGFRV